MTSMIETMPRTVAAAPWPPASRRASAPVRRRGRDAGRTGPGRPRPAGVAVRYRGTGVLVSDTSHRRRVITPTTTVVLALLAAVITVWLGLVADFGAALTGAGAAAAAVPDQLGVVQVRAGESLQHLAARVAPGAPAGQVVDRIRELNRLDSVALDAGQTLIAPIG